MVYLVANFILQRKLNPFFIKYVECSILDERYIKYTTACEKTIAFPTEFNQQDLFVSAMNGFYRTTLFLKEYFQQVYFFASNKKS